MLHFGTSNWIWMIWGHHHFRKPPCDDLLWPVTLTSRRPHLHATVAICRWQISPFLLGPDPSAKALVMPSLHWEIMGNTNQKDWRLLYFPGFPIFFWGVPEEETARVLTGEGFDIVFSTYGEFTTKLHNRNVSKALQHPWVDTDIELLICPPCDCFLGEIMIFNDNPLSP